MLPEKALAPDRAAAVFSAAKAIPCLRVN